MQKIISKPLYILISYVVLILIFAFIYWILPKSSFDDELSWAQSLYLSVVTITTLGYGDITPKDNIGMFTAALESVIGILIIGVLINSAWKNYSDRVEEEQSKKINEALKASNKSNLLSYYSYLSSVMDEYKYANSEMTTPFNVSKSISNKINYKFKFSDLISFLRPSLRMKYGFEMSNIEIYYNEEKAVVNELKFILANFGLEEFSELKELIIEFLNVTHVTSFETVLINHAKQPKSNAARKILEELIPQFDGLPPKEYHYSNVLSPVVALYQTIPIKMKLVEDIELGFRSLQNKA